MPNPIKDESKEEYVARFMSSEEAKKSFPDEKQRLAVAYSKWKQSHKEMLSRPSLFGLKLKEEGEDIIVTGIVATTHPDRVGDILSEAVIDQIVDYINSQDLVGGQNGAYRSVSLYHDWIKQADPSLDEAAFLEPTARKITLPDGHIAAEVDAKLNKFYKGDVTIDEIKYRIDNGQIAGFSIEYDTDESHSKTVKYNGDEYRFINGLTEFGGVGLARARLIANPHAVIYKEIEEKSKEEKNMTEEVKETVTENTITTSEAAATSITSTTSHPPFETAVVSEEAKEVKEENSTKEEGILLKVKEQVLKELRVENKIVKNTKESEQKMAETTNTISLSVKEMNESLRSNKGAVDMMRFKEAVNTYFAENPEMDVKYKEMYATSGIPLKTTLQTKCVGNKLVIVGQLQMKSTLDTTTNAGAYTESPVEFADLFVPGLVETFNNQTNLFGAMRKVNHLMGAMYYGWKLKTDQASSLAVDPDDASVVKNPVDKIKLHTDIKEYRVGVSVSDYTSWHARATMGDLLMLEAEARMGDLLRDINDDLFTEQVDTAGNKVLGLEAVADSAGNTSMYGKTRSTANRLAPDAAADTYVAVAGALTTAILRNAMTKVEIEGARRENLRIVTNPQIRDDIFELEDGNQNYFNAPKFGFDGQISYDGVPVIVDSSCPTDSLFVVDFESYYIVISRGPQMIGLAKVGAAEDAYISTYLAAVYEQPRRIHMLNTLS